MIGYLYETITPDGVPDDYCFEIHSTPTTRVSWSGWWATVDEALTAPPLPTPSCASIKFSYKRRIREFNNIDRLDGAKLRLHSTYTSISHPELFI